MKMTQRRFQSFLEWLTTLPEGGVYPYTADPTAPGLHTFGQPVSGAPYVIAGNSRHELKQLDRVLSPIGAYALAVDTGSLGLYALAAGKLELETLLRTVKEHDSGGDACFLLPYPLWHALAGDEANREALLASGVEPGPANRRDLPLYLATGGRLTEDMYHYRPSLRERLHVAAAHGVLFLLIALLPLALVGWAAILIALGITVMSVAGVGVLLPQLEVRLARRGKWFPIIVLVLLLILLVALTTLLLGISPLHALAFGLAMVGATGWLAIVDGLCSSPRFEPEQQYRCKR